MSLVGAPRLLGSSHGKLGVSFCPPIGFGVWGLGFRVQGLGFRVRV